MPKNSDTLHRVAATFQGGRDPDQDAVINWLSTLPKNDKGQLHRSALKYHITRAILQYITSGATTSQSLMPAMITSGPGFSSAHVSNNPTQVSTKPNAGVMPSNLVNSPPNNGDVKNSASTDFGSIPVLTETISQAGPTAKKGGGMRNLIKSSMRGTPIDND